jgi:hypothetical protein
VKNNSEQRGHGHTLRKFLATIKSNRALKLIVCAGIVALLTGISGCVAPPEATPTPTATTPPPVATTPAPTTPVATTPAPEEVRKVSVEDIQTSTDLGRKVNSLT